MSFFPLLFWPHHSANYRLLLLPIRSIRIWSVPKEHFWHYHWKCSGFAFCYLFYGLVFQSSPINPSTLCLLTKRLLLLKMPSSFRYQCSRNASDSQQPTFSCVVNLLSINQEAKFKIFYCGNIWWQSTSQRPCMHAQRRIAKFPFPKFENWALPLVTVLLHDNSDHHYHRIALE